MANNFDTLMNTVAWRFSELTDYLKPHAAFLSAVTTNPVPPDYKAQNDIVKLNQLNIGGSVVDHQTSSITTADISETPTTIQLAKTPTKAFVIETQLASRVADSPGLLDESLKIIITQFLEYFNGEIASLFTTTNFSTSGNITGTGTGATADALSHADVTAMWSTLATRKIPVTDMGNVFLITHPYIYGKMLDDADYTKATSIGNEYASQMRTSGSLMPINGMLPIFDSQAPTTGSGSTIAYTSAAFHRRAVITQFATPQPPVDGRAYRYANVFGIPLLIVPQYDTNLSGTGGASNKFVISALWNRIPFRTDHCVLHTTPGA